MTSASSPTAAPRPMRPAHLIPLLGYLIPTLVIGYGFVIPGSPIAGVNELTIGFGTAVLGAAVTYVLGIRTALRS
jgi:ABC-type Fe3+ transport system permease subunit